MEKVFRTFFWHLLRGKIKPRREGAFFIPLNAPKDPEWKNCSNTLTLRETYGHVAHNTPKSFMKYLGIDYGAKRIGIALSDPDGRMAFPRVVIDATKDPVTEIAELCKKEGVEKIVVGDSRDFDNKPNAIMKKIMPFSNALLLATGLPVDFILEAYSSQEAKRTQGENELHDASAASIILQSYLDGALHPNN